MNWLENLLIIGGISFDVFAAMESQGSLVAKIAKKELFFSSLLACFWQTVSFFAGYVLSGILIRRDRIAENEQIIGTGIAVIIFAGLGVHLMIKAIRNEKIPEHREACFDQKKILQKIAGTGVYTLLAGIAFGLVFPSNMAFSLAMLAVMSVLAVVGGVYTGYHFGMKQRRKAYALGAALLWLVGADLLLWRVWPVLMERN